MNILVINSGSSSLKFQLLKSNKAKTFNVLCKGIVDGIGLKTCQFRFSNHKKNIEKNLQCNDHEQALNLVLKTMVEQKIVASLMNIDAIGHRVVHGGEKYKKACKINAQTIKTIRTLSELAPLHNPPNVKGIEACDKLLKHAPQVAVFDTSFHNTIPEKAFLYALPYELYSKHSIRRYGFHGTSHEYVSKEAIKMLEAQNQRHNRNKKVIHSASKIISCHMGNGSSVAAIMNGKSVDTSMGLTPLEGIPMGTRSGDIDAAIIFHLLKQHRMTPETIEKMLIKESGLKGLSGISSDVRILWDAIKKGNKRAQLSFTVLAYRIAKYIGSYAAAMNGVDAIVFTAGIGEHAYYLRRDICKYLEFLGVDIDPQKNKKDALIISKNTSKIKVFVIPTNEEAQIAKETLSILT